MSHVIRHIFNNKFKCNLFLLVRNFQSDSRIEIYDEVNDSKHFANLRKHLRTKSVSIKDGYTCLKADCCLCTHRNERHPAYINKKTGLYLCPKCDVRKKLSEVLQIFEQGKQLHINNSECSPYIPTNSNMENVTQSICDSLKIKGLTVDDFNAVGSMYDAKLNLLHFPLRNSVNYTVGEKIYDLTKQTEKTFQRLICSGLLVYGAQTKKKAIVVSNILDFLVIVAQHFDNYAVVCLPYLLKSLPQECLPGFEIFSELILWFDCDLSSWDAARTFSHKLNQRRCLLIRPTDSEPSPYKAYKRNINLQHILIRATPVLHKSITTFGALKHDILSELQNKDKVNGVKWKRFPVLNKLLKGHRRGELTIITGPTGSGKTTFMSEYSLDLVLQGVSTLWGSFEIRNSRLAATLLRQFVGYSLEKKIKEFDHWTAELEKYPLYFMTFHGQQTINIVMEAIEHAQYVLDISHVIIDNLQFMMGVSARYKRDKFWEQDEIIASFRSFATKHNVHVTLVMHPRKERDEDDLTTSSIFGSAKATQEADNVLIIQDKRLVSVRGKKYLQIAKNRYSGDLGVMNLDFDKEALSYSSTKKKEK